MDEKLPINSAYSYLIEKGFENEVNDIKESKEKHEKYSTTDLRRGKVIELLEKNNLWDDFIKRWWSYGNTKSGRTVIKRLKKHFYEFTHNNENNIIPNITNGKINKIAENSNDEKEGIIEKIDKPKKIIKEAKPKTVLIKKTISKEFHIEELIDNVIRVKIGLRILIKVLEPIVINELKLKYKSDWWEDGILKVLSKEQTRGLAEDKLDIPVCLSLLDINWDLFRKILPKNAHPTHVRSWINELKVDRNINAHDSTEDISNVKARRTLETISLLCDSFVAKEEAGKIQKIRETIPEQNKENPSKNH